VLDALGGQRRQQLSRQAATPVPTRSVEAYEYYLRGRQFFYRFDKRSLHLAREMFRRAAEIDPTDPFPHTNLSMFYQKKGMTEVAEQHSAMVTQLNIEAQKRAQGA